MEVSFRLLTSVLLLVVGCSGLVDFKPGYQYQYKYSASTTLKHVGTISTSAKVNINVIGGDKWNRLCQFEVKKFHHTIDKNPGGPASQKQDYENLANWFSFNVSNSGEILGVQYPENEKLSAVIQKKVLLGTFSARLHASYQDLKQGEQHQWRYLINETGYEGTHEVEYEGQDTGEELLFKRKKFGHAVPNSESTNEKEIWYHKEKQVPAKIVLDEKFTAPRKAMPGYQLPAVIPVGFGESHLYESDDSFELPEMHSFSNSQMELTDAIPIPAEDAKLEAPYNLVKDTLYITEYPKMKLSLDAVAKDVTGNLTCMREVRPRYARERMKCFQELVSIISHLEEEDLSTVADKYIQFHTREVNTTEDMEAIIDAFGSAVLEETQKLLTERILLKKPPNASLLKRLFSHFVNLETSPPMIFIDALEDLVFQGGQFSDDEDEREITTMATLLLGSLAGGLKSTYPERAESLVARMETELKLHDPQKHRTIRSSESTTHENHKEQRKSTLLLSLGNAGLDRSYDHILSYINTTDSPQLLRRRGATAISTYHHEDAASVLLSIALDNNHEEHVRYDALLEYRRHPMAVPISDIQYHLVRGLTNITGLNKKDHSRLKRGIFDGFKFKLQLPGVEWNKQVGTNQIGANFGLTIRNIMDLDIAPQEGHFKVDVLDEAYAVANLGILGIHQDLARVRFCFRGHIKYGLNILQEFNFEDIFNIVKLLDSVVNNIVGSIKETINSFRQLFESTSDLSFQKIVQRFADAFADIPFKIDDLRAIGQKAIQTIGEIINPPNFITDVSNVIHRVTALVTDIKTDVTEFYDSIADAITVTLPWAIEQLKEAVNMVINTIKNLFKSPLSALGDIQKAILKIQLAISSVLEAKKRIEDACLFTKGQRPYWFDIKNVIIEIWEDILTAKDSVLGAFKWFNGKHSGDEIFKEFTGVDANVIRQQILVELLESLDIFAGPLQVIQELAAPFVSTYESVVKTINAVKTGYTTVKQAYAAARTLISKIFGPKIHTDFPKKLLESDNCGNGFYPSTARGRYKHQGVDLEVSRNAEIVVPFTGDVSATSADEISIVADELNDIEIILNQISLYSGKDGMKVFKGEPLGRATSSGCTPNSIHLAMRKVGTDEYIDPTRYLEKRKMPKPKWIQECDDYIVYLLFKVYAEGSLTKGPKDDDTTPQRGQEPDVSGLEPLPAGKRKKREIPFIAALRQKADDFTDRLGLPRISEIGPVLAGFNIKDIKIGQILDLLETFGLKELKEKLENALSILEDLLSTQKCVAAETMDDETLKLGLKARGKSSGGSRRSLIDRFKDPDEGCKHLHKQLPGGIACRFTDNCLSVTCCVELELVVIRRTLEASLTLDPCSLELTFTIGKFKRSFSITDHLAEEYSGSIVDDLNVMDVVTFTVSYSIKRDGNKVTVNLSASMCAKDKCKKFAKVFDGLTLTLPQCSGVRSLQARRSKLIDFDQLKEKTLQEIKELLDIKNPGSFDIQELMKNLQEAYLEIAKDALNNFLGKLFPGQFSSFDVCMNGVKTYGPFDKTFFRFQINFFLGPVPMQFVFSSGGSWKVECGFKLCFLTMKAEGTATPHIGAYVSGELYINLWLFKAGLKLTGYLLTTTFPTKAEVGFSKFPLDVGVRMDLELVPLRLELRAILKLTVKLLFIKIEKTLINKLLWHYTTPSITANIFDLHNKEPDNSPPVFSSFSTTVSETENGKRASTTSQCSVNQIPNRDYTEPAFQLALAVEDDRSTVEVSYCIGTFAGGSDLASDEVLGGPSSVIEQVLPSRIPLYFTVKAANSAGGTASVTCSLSSYDTTPPAGRVIPDFFTTSHPNVLKASGMAVDETPLTERKEAIGFGRGVYGDQAFPWSDISSRALKSPTKSVQSSLLQFTSPRLGKLRSTPHQVKVGYTTPGKCASTCLALPSLKCISFNYDYGTSGRCELLEEVEGHGVKIHAAGHFHYFERLGIGHAVTFNHRDLQLNHNQLYYFNYYLKNQLGYTNILTSRPVLVDFTPVEPGPLQNVQYDETVKEPCHELLPDEWENRCVDEASIPNHRYIIDGEGSSTVFNGHTPCVDVLYTRANKYVSANWDGFKDNETGIFGYTWSVGTEQCQENIHPHKDPHAHLFDESEWTHTGLAYPLDLKDGLYYVTVRAINKVEYGGPLATSVCHSTPYAIDNTEPFIHEVFDMLYDEKTYIISASYNVSDPLSNIKEMHIGLGRSTRDTYILDWFLHGDTDSVEFVHHILDGVPTWLRIRAVNNVDLRTSGNGPYPIVVDTTHPLAGDLYDGKSHGRQVNFQSSQSEICANWENFRDPDTGIADYLWGVGTSPGDSDVVDFRRLGHTVHLQCDNTVDLTHNTRYYSTLVAYNRGHKRLNVSANSEGVLVDLTPPAGGWLKDGDTAGEDIRYSSSPATVSGNWGGFTDPESGIQQYSVAVRRQQKDQAENEVIHESKSVGMDTSFRWHHFHLHQGDQVFVNLNVTNRALGITSLMSDGFVLDLTPPKLIYLRDGMDPDKDAQYSASTTELTANWKFTDKESGVDYLELQVYQMHGGTRSPIGESFPLDGAVQNWTSTESLSLNIGALYTIRVHAINAAGLIAVHETDGVLIDPTPPEILFVHAGVLSGMDEELTNGSVVVANTGILAASWLGLDGESGIDAYWIGLGTTAGGDDIIGFYNVGEETDIILTELPLELYENGSPIYYLSVKAQDGAGSFSTTMTSSPIKVVAADVSGIVFDGTGSTELSEMASTIMIDVDFQLESTTASLHFEGFESAQHGIAAYEWGIGTTPGSDDVQPFTDMGIVSLEEPSGSGIAQILLPLSLDNRYFSSVRAITGAGNILESTSDGFGVDQSAPTISIVSVGEEDEDKEEQKQGTVYQSANVGSLSAEWTVGDNESSIAGAWFAIGSSPVSADVYNSTNTNKRTSLPAGLLTPSTDGTPNIVTVSAINKVGLISSDVSPPVVFDATPPELVDDMACPQHISGEVPFTCSWDSINDRESGIQHYIVSVGVSEGDDSVVNSTTIYPPTSHLSVSGLNESFLQQGATLYTTVAAVNGANLRSTSYSRAIHVDTTPPVPGVVVEVNDNNVTFNGDLEEAVCNAKEECLSMDAVCQMSLDHIRVAWEPFHDPETDIVRYEIAIGTGSGRRDLQDFTEVPSGTTSYVFTHLDLLSVAQVFATVRGYNGAGQFALALSDGVFISRISAGLQPLGQQFVYDGNQPDTDMDFQASSEQLSARWSFGDPCPMVKYDWSIHRMDGVVIQPFTTLPGDQTFGDNSNIKAKDGESFYIVVRGTNQLGDDFVLRSDGISIRKEPLIPGEVRDGPVLGLDQNFQLSITTLSANWDQFGIDREVAEVLDGNERSDLGNNEHQTILYYEVAVGSDRRYASTRSNIVPFANVGKNRTVSLHDLPLTPRATYYVTVRGYSVTTSTTDVTSNGIQVGVGSEVISRGRINVQRYISSTSTMTFSWDGFEFSLPVRYYHWGLGTVKFDTGSIECSKMHQFDESGALTSAYASLFDVHPFTNVDKDTLVDLTNMTLEHKGTYYVTVMASDESLQCDVVSSPVTVDITLPETGQVQVGPFADLPVQFTDRSDEMTVLWEDFLDEESGILQYDITLLGPVQCGNTADDAPQLTDPVTLHANYSSYTFVDLFLEESMVYFVQLKAVNHATGFSTVTSSPVLIDNRDPIAGDVIDGDTFQHDVSHQSSTSLLHGSFTLFHGQEYQCSYNHHALDEPTEEWSPVTAQGVWGTSIEASRIKFVPEQLSYSDNNGLTVTMVRDVRAERMISGGYVTVLNHEGPGVFQVDMVAAGSKLDSVTSLVFWYGPAGVVGGFEMLEEADEDSNFTTSAPTTTAAPMENPWQIVNDGSDEISDEDAVLRTLPYTGIGMDIFHEVTTEGPTKYYALLWSRFQDEPSALQYEKIELGFDASEAWHTYSLKYTVDRTDATQELWGVELDIDGQYFSTITGIPPVSLSTKLILAVRSKQGAVAEFHDVFNPPSAGAYFKNLRTPPSADMLCRYGTPFQDGSTTILKLYAGVGTSKGSDDVKTFFEVEDPCTPCMDDCSTYSCDMNCTVDDTTLHHVLITNLHLSTHMMITQDNATISVPALYYVTIKAVSGSGRFALSSSDGVYIDATPPVFESLYHVDLAWSEDEQSDFQGSNSTIAARWEAYDIESQVVEYFWAIGSAPLSTDIQDFVSVGLSTNASNSDLEGSLEPLHTYYATVMAVNGAGLNTTMSTTGVTFLEESPSSDNVTIEVKCERQNDGSSSEVDVSVCPGIKSSVEVSWPDFDKREGITGYYFIIGSTKVLEDIIPETQVGYNESGTVLVDNGQILINGRVVANISDLRMQSQDQSSPKVNKFNMEPGRKMYIKMKACNSAHKCSIIDLKVIVVSREGDVVAKATNSSKVVVTLSSSSATESVRTSVTKRVVIVADGVPHGDGLVAGMLSKHDVEEEYISGASLTFTPFIVDPQTTKNDSERSLNGRLRDFEESFFISLLHDKPLKGPLEITIPINPDLIHEGTLPVLLFWSTERQQWMDASRTCLNSENNMEYDWEQNLLHVNVCSTHPASETSGDSVRRRRSSEEEFFTGSTQFAEFSVDSDVVNTPPVVTSPSAMWMYEDAGTLRAQLQAQDAEEDELMFSLDTEEDVMGDVVLSPEGLLEYTPCLHCFGLVEIGYVVQEKPTEQTAPLELRATLTIDVRPQNDNPDLLFLRGGVNVVSDQGPNTYSPVELPVKQGNKLSIVLWLYDVDAADDLVFNLSQPQYGDVQVGPVCKKVSFLSTPCNMVNDLNIINGTCTVCKRDNLNTTGSKEVDDLSWALTRLTYISRNESFFGKDTFAIHGTDGNGGTSKILPIDVFVLQKCRNDGTCIGPAEDPECNDLQLAFGFDGYVCDCTEDFIGEFCQIEIVPCSPPTAPANGAVSPEDSTSYQDVVEFWCNPGYELVGDSAHTCHWDGSWNGSTPTCDPVPCPALSDPANGALSPSGPHVYHDVVTFTCSEGYVVAGVSTITCQADGTWTGSVPTCKSCHDLYNFPVDTFAIYKNRCHWFSRKKDKRRYAQAKRFCEGRGGRLVTIKMEDKQAFLEGTKYLKVKRAKRRNLWIGLDDKSAEKTLKWSDGTTLGDYNNWKFKLGGHRKRDCAAIHSSDLKWVLVNCNTKKFAFICEMDDTMI